MSLITGPEWETAVHKRLRRYRIPSIICERSGAPSEHAGGRLRETSAGPADFQVRGLSWRMAIEVKKADHRFQLSKLTDSQADDLYDADHGLVVLRIAGDSAFAADFIYLLDWVDLAPLWQSHRDGIAPHGAASLSERDCADMARAAFAEDGLRLRADDHGDWKCPDFLPAVLDAWGIE